MWLNPPKRLIGGAKQWSNIARSDYLCVQVSPRHRQHRIFRLITRRYPNYKLAESHEQDTIYQGFMVLTEQLNELEDKVTFKRISQHAHQLAIQSDKIINRTPSSIALSDEDNSEIDQNESTMDSPDPSVSGSMASLNDTPVADTPTQNNTVDLERETSYDPLTLDLSNGIKAPLETPEDIDLYCNPLENATWVDPDLMAAFSYFFEGPQLGRNGDSNSSKRKRKSDAEKKRDPQSLLDIPFMFISLLTYPDLPQESDNDKAQKIRFAALREIAFVRNRRRMLLGLTIYCLFLRFCSFDFFLFALFCTNCGMLYLMKKSGSVNVTMAKRAVRQRITWARQWTGLLFTRNNQDKSSSSNKAKNVPPTPQRKGTSSSLSSVSMLRTNSSPADLPPPSPIPTGVNNSGSGRFSSIGRALFRHKSNKSISQNTSIPSPSPSSVKPDIPKIDTKRPLMTGYRKSLDGSQLILEGSPKVKRSQSEISLPQLVARHSVDGSVPHASTPGLPTALSELSAAQQRAAKRTSTSF